MEIEIKSKIKRISMCEIPFGEPFEYNSAYYIAVIEGRDGATIKDKEALVCNLTENTIQIMDYDTKVFPVEGKLVIGE